MEFISSVELDVSHEYIIYYIKIPPFPNNTANNPDNRVRVI